MIKLPFTTYYQIFYNIRLVAFHKQVLTPGPIHPPYNPAYVRYSRTFSHDVTTAILVFQTNSPGIEFFPYVNAFFCSNKFAKMLAT